MPSFWDRIVTHDWVSLVGIQGEMSWVAEVFFVVFITLVLSLFSSRILSKLHLQFQRTKNLWDDALVTSLMAPLRTLIWILGLTFAVEIAFEQTELSSIKALYPIRDVLVIAILAWFVLRFIRTVETDIVVAKQEAGEEVDPSTVDAISKLLRISVIITAGLVVLQTLGFSISGVLAFGGVGGIAVGFAAKDLLANFFGALIVYLDRPFKVGDWIRSPDRSVEGTVEKIGWRQTCIRTFDKRPLYVPNALFSTIAIENPSRMTHRRIYETIGVRYDDVDKVPKIIADVKKMLQKHKEIDDSQTLIVNLNEYGASSVNFFVYCFTHTTNWIEYHTVKEDVLLKISDVITGLGAEIAFPTQTLHVPEPIIVKGKK